MPVDDLKRLLIGDRDRPVDSREVDLAVVDETVVHTLATDVDASFGIVQGDCIAQLESGRERFAVDEEHVVRMGPVRLQVDAEAVVDAPRMVRPRVLAEHVPLPHDVAIERHLDDELEAGDRHQERARMPSARRGARR